MPRRRHRLPLPGKALLWLFLNAEDYDQAAGDFEEFFRCRAEAEGQTRARLGFWHLLLKSLPSFISDAVYWRVIMSMNTIKVAWRNIRKRRLFSFLNVAGLAVSLACGLLILLHVRDELSYEKSFPKSDRIYRVQTDSQYGTNFRHWAASAPALGPGLQRSFPEVEAAARLFSTDSEILSYRPPGGTPRRFEELRGYIAESSAIGMFDLEFLHGDPRTALEASRSIVLTSSLASKYFGSEDPVGKTLMNETRKEILLVTGVIRDLPKNSHLQIDYLVSLPTFVVYADGNAEILNHPTWKAAYTYVLLRPGSSLAGFDAKAPAFMKEVLRSRPGRVESIRLQPIRRIHLHSKLSGEIGPNSDIVNVYVFSGAALLILLIAAVNFINLATAQSFKRMKEVGVRKVAGARRGQIIKQFLGESAVLTAISALAALVLLRLALPFYNGIVGKSLGFGEVLTSANAAFILAVVVLTGLLAGLYPSLFVSGFQPAGALKNVRDPRSSAARLRKSLVIFQFVISIILIFSTVTMSRQLRLFRGADLGFDLRSTIAVWLYGDFGEKAVQNAKTLKEEILSYKDVRRVALASDLFGRPFSNERLVPPGRTATDVPILRFLRTDEDFLETAGLKLIAGRNFNPASDRNSAYIVNETAVAALDLKDPLGLEVGNDVGNPPARIVGVVKDFHFSSLHNPIEPLVLRYEPAGASYLLVKAEGESLAETVAFLKRTAERVYPDVLFSYEFVDDVFDKNYAAEDRSYALFKVFSAIALLVGCLGLFGLTAYAAEIRVKEIGIRKTLGASTPSLIFLLTGDFLRGILVAGLIAWPLAYFGMTKWLQTFASRVQIHVWTFIISGAMAFLLAMATTGYQALKAAREDPVHSLRYE